MGMKTFGNILYYMRDSSRIAAICGDEQITYSELWNDGVRIANGLLRAGVRKGDRVAVDTGRTLNYVRMLTGIALSGSIGVNIDRTLEKKHTKRIIEDSSPSLIVDNSNIKELNSSQNSDLLEEGEKLLGNLLGEDPYWLIYSSGSTGTPKGSVLCHETVIITCMACDENVRTRYMADNCERLLVDGSLSFLAAIFFLLYALCNRKTAVFANDEEFNSLSKLSGCIKRNRVDFICRPNSWISKALENPDYAEAIRSVRVFSLGGEKNADDVVCALKKHAPDAAVFLSYGSSELIVVSDFLWKPGNTDLLGNPIRGVKVFLLDDDGKPVKTGDMGEICVGGRTAELGSYWNAPELTAKKYETHHLYGRICHTGDMGRIGDDGNIHILGRKDNMIKIHGVRIETAYIERIILGFQGIHEVLVVAKSDEAKALCAYYTCESTALDQKKLRRYLADELPYYMIPTYLIQIDSMPLNTSGKLDRNALSKLPVKKVRLSDGDDREISDIEEILLTVFERVLKLPDTQKVCVYDNFFELGGDSISGMEAVYLLEQEGYSLEFKYLYAAPTAKLLAEFVYSVEDKNGLTNGANETFSYNCNTEDVKKLEKKLEKKRAEAEEKLGKPIESVYPVTYSVSVMLQNDNSWMMCVPFLLNTAPDRDKWNKCINEIKATHESLRSVFLQDKDGYIRTVLKDAEVEAFYVDLSVLAKEGEQLQEQQKKYFETTENLLYANKISPVGNSLFKVGLVKVNNAESVLLLNVSHLLFDEAGTANLARDILAYCRDGEKNKSDTPLFRKHLEHVYFSDREKALRHWEPLCCHDRRNIVELRMAPERKEAPNIRLAIKGDGAFRGKVLEYCKNEGVSFAVFIHALVGRALMKVSKKNSVSFLSVCANRNQGEIRLAGLFTQSVPFKYSAKDTWTDIQEQLIEAQTNSWLMDDPKFYENVAKRYDDAILLNIRDDYHESFINGCTLMDQRQLVGNEEMALRIDGKVDPPPHGRLRIYVNRTWPHLYMLDFLTGEVAPDFVEKFKKILDAELSFMTSENESLCHSGSESAEDGTLTGTVRDILLKSIERRKNKTLFVFPESKKSREISAYQFRDWVWALGTWLYEHGFRQKRIAIVGRNSAEWVLMAYAILCGENSAVMIDPDLSAEDIAARIRQAGASLVAGEDSFTELPDMDIEKLSFSQLFEKVSEGEKLIDNKHMDYIKNFPKPENEAVILFTTGTTGTAKAVGLSHRQLFLSTDGMYRTLLNHKENMTMMITLPLYHIGAFSGMLLLYTWFCAKIVVVREYSHILLAVKELKPGYATLVPRLADMILAWLNAKKDNGEHFDNPFVEIALVGTTISPMYREAFSVFGTNVIDCYGMTESSGAILMSGTPINGMEIKLGNGERQGEILVKGPEIFDGYLEDEADEECFENGWFHTGDIGLLTDEGLYAVTGRLKNLIILSNGENVSPEEVEDHLNSSELIRESRVFAFGDLLAADIVPECGEEDEPNELEMNEKWLPLIRGEVDRINETLPPYKRVSEIVLRSQELPRNALGKLLRN